jgi:hypothetical protein
MSSAKPRGSASAGKKPGKEEPKSAAELKKEKQKHDFESVKARQS